MFHSVYPIQGRREPILGYSGHEVGDMLNRVPTHPIAGYYRVHTHRFTYYRQFRKANLPTMQVCALDEET